VISIVVFLLPIIKFPGIKPRMEGLDKGGQGPISGCCAIEEEEEEDYYY
jgi:hypothetical protein